MLITCRPDFEGNIRSLYVQVTDGVDSRTERITKFVFVDYDEDGTVLGIELTSEASKSAIGKAFGRAVAQSSCGKAQLRGVRKTVARILAG